MIYWDKYIYANIFLGFTNIKCQSQEINQLENYFYKTCLKYSGNSETFNKLRADIYEMYEYFKASSQLLPAKKKEFCKHEVPRLTFRIKNIEVDIKSCLPGNDTFLALFARQSFEEFLHFLCSGESSMF